MTMEIDQEVSDMCNLSLGLWEEAVTKGKHEGMLLGEEKGRLEGRIESLRDMILDGFTTIEKLRATGRYTPEELDYVAKSLKQ